MLKLIFVNETNLLSIRGQRTIVLDKHRNIGVAIGKVEIKQMLTPANIKLAQAVESLSERLAE